MIAGAVYLGLAYLLAAVPFGVVVTTLWGGDVDIRSAGSGNIGGTNVARVYGWRLAGAVIALDVAKGFVPVLLAQWLWPNAEVWWPALVSLTCFVGHCFPVYLEFRGGKGVATGAGGLLALSPYVTLPAVAVWILLLGLTGRSSVAALGATASVVVVAAVVDPTMLPVVGMLGLGILATHVPNVRRLVRGEEGAVVRPVRWGRASEMQVDPELLLRQGPTGGPAVPLWREVAEPEITAPHPADGPR